MRKDASSVSHLEEFKLLEKPMDVRHSAVERSVYYKNYSGLSLAIKDRQNIGFILPPSQPSGAEAAYFGSLIVTIVYKLNAEVKHDVAVPFCDDGESFYDQELRDRLLTELNKPRTGNGILGSGRHGTTSVSYAIKTDEIDRLGGSVYIPALDMLVFRVGDYNDQTALSHYDHPYSAGGKNRQFVSAVNHSLRGNGIRSTDSIQTLDGCLIYAVMLVDNEQRIDSRYVNINGDVRRIKSRTDPELESGYYTYWSIPITDERMDYRTERYHFKLDELGTEQGFYRTYDEAQYHGNPEAVRKQELLDREAKLKEEEYKLRNRKLELEKEKMELTQELERERVIYETKLEEARRRTTEQTEKIKTQEEEIRQRQKEEQERRSYARKDFNDTIKFLAVAITTVGSLAYAFAKLGNK